MTSKLYYRWKKGKVIIEQKVDGRSKYIKTLPPPAVLLELLEPQASFSAAEKSDEKASKIKASLIDAELKVDLDFKSSHNQN